MKGITVLGSTGSIGKSTLDILSLHRDQFKVIALTAKSKIEELLNQCRQFNPVYAVVSDSNDAKKLASLLKAANLSTQVLQGVKAMEEVASLPEVEYVMSAIVGAAGLLPTLAAAKAGKRILLANKEALVMSGDLFMQTIQQSNATLLPVDSEHNAIFQCLPLDYVTGHTPSGVNKLILTASGGPFRKLPLKEFQSITPQQAVAHPNWNMGAKISVDSATMMNKGFEVIEAFWLFKMDLNKIEVIIHPQSIIHSLVEYEDGSILAQLGSPDMRTPIAYALSWPKRIKTEVKKLDLLALKQLSFEPVDHAKFPCLHLAYSILKAGGTASTLLNAANEIAVASFLAGKMSFVGIPNLIAEVLDRLPIGSVHSLEAILEADEKARRLAETLVNQNYCFN